MIGRSEKYCGDERMGEYLKKLGSLRTLHEIYGLFHGCIAASNVVTPSTYFPLLFDEDGANYETEEQANEFFGNLTNLRNRIARWSPKAEPFIVLNVDYPETLAGLTARSSRYYSLIAYFIKGLDLGGTLESDFSEDAFKALKSLSEAQVFFKQFPKWAKISETTEDTDLKETFASIKRLEDITDDCIARINLGLEPARMRAAKKMRQFAELQKKTPHVKDVKTRRNKSCPCGSGKKYKKCCGVVH